MRAFFRAFYRRLRGGQLSPTRAGLSVAAGVFIGCLPLYGVHWALCLLLCLPLHLDVILCYAAAHISNPIVLPALLALELELGSRILTGEPALLDVQQVLDAGLGEHIAQAFVGAIVIGGVLAPLLGFATLFGLRKLTRGKKSELRKTLERTLARYDHASRAQRSYVKNKLFYDPVFEELYQLRRQMGPLPENLGEVVDIGCGRGQLGLFLLELGWAKRLVGFDWDQRKVDVAQLAAAGDASFVVLDATKAPLRISDTVLLVDVLHYLGVSEQNDLLRRVAASLRDDGCIVIRELDATWGPRSLLTVALEHAATRLSVNRARRLHFRKAVEYAEVLHENGMRAEIVASPGSPLANVLIVAQKRSGLSAPSSRGGATAPQIPAR